MPPTGDDAGLYCFGLADLEFRAEEGLDGIWLSLVWNFVNPESGIRAAALDRASGGRGLSGGFRIRRESALELLEEN